MKKINILTDGFSTPNGVAFLFPIVKFGKAIRDAGYSVHLHKTITKGITDCDVLCLDGKFFDSWWLTRFDEAIETIQSLKKHNKLYWFDQSDSSGTLLGKVIPLVDRYYKSQTLSKKEQYCETPYASRIFLDYYHKKHGIEDRGTYIEQPIEDKNDLNKIHTSWNSGLMNYGWISPYLTRILKTLPFKSLMQFSHSFVPSNNNREFDVTCRMGLSHTRQTIVFHRKKIQNTLRNFVKTDKLSRKQYLDEIQNSKICVSPFGFGEITLKDFETFLLGSLLIKPNMNHMKTWPNLFIDKQTCLFHDWEADNLIEKIEWALANEYERIQIAQNAQDIYKQHTTSQEAPELFAKHFVKIMSER